MIPLICEGHGFRYEMEHLVRLFFPGAEIRILDVLPEPEPDQYIWTRLVQEDGFLLPQVSVSLSQGQSAGASGVAGTVGESEPQPLPAGELERRMGQMLYAQLRDLTGITPPWGILTGVRPVRLCRQWQQQGRDWNAVLNYMRGAYLVQGDKAELAVRTAVNQHPILARNTPDSYSLYVSLPFCPTRCLYCSFVSHAIDRAAKLIPDYIRLLRQELEETARIASRLNLKLHTVYIGGGTPTALSDADLEAVLQSVRDFFDLSSLMEYTVEAGRPDTITPEKLGILKKFGVDRISINPQTMDDTILQAIGRKHTAAQVEESFRLARAAGFSAINMDLIAGLPGERVDSFAHTLNRVLALAPENITLHTLTVKRSSRLREQEDAFSGSPLALNDLLHTAQARFTASGYEPCYLYRQKGTVQNLENTGYTLPGYGGIYNVYSMEEVHTILAVGAGAITKLCRGGHIRRICNYKYPYEYIGRFDELIARKTGVEEFYEKYSGDEVHAG